MIRFRILGNAHFCEHPSKTHYFKNTQDISMELSVLYLKSVDSVWYTFYLFKISTQKVIKKTSSARFLFLLFFFDQPVFGSRNLF